MGDLVIGVGGTGRGAITWLDKLLKEEYGGRGDFNFLIIDGPDSDPCYELIDGHSLEYGKEPRDFYHLTKNPKEQIGLIQTEKDVPYIGEWLQPEEAQKIDKDSLDPAKGFGQSRIPGRANFYLEADTIASRIREFLQASPNDQEGQRIFVVGSMVGGTGSGQLLDVGCLVKSMKKQGAYVIGVIGLPNGYSTVFKDPRDKEQCDARFFAGLRELERLMGDKEVKENIVNIEYSKNTVAKTNRIFDLCFLADGSGLLEGTEPKNGICCAMALMVLQLSRVKEMKTANVVAWVNAHMPVKPYRFGTFGIHSYLYSPSQIIKAFRLNFASAFYKKILEGPLTPEGCNLCDSLLNTVPFTRKILLHSEGKLADLEPPEKDDGPINSLVNNFNCGIEGVMVPYFPFNPCRDLIGEIKNHGFLGLGGMDNSEVVSSCSTLSNNYIGNPGIKEEHIDTVWAYIGEESGNIEKIFENNLITAIKGIFYDLTKNPAEPFNLLTKPHSLIEARDFLSALTAKLDEFSKFVEARHNHYLNDKNVIKNALKEVEESSKRLGEKKRDVRMQDEHKEISQKLLRIRVWDALLQGMKNLLERLKERLQILWKQVGDPTEGWLAYLNDLFNNVTTLYNDFQRQRYEMKEKLTLLRYLPRANTAGERDMYKHFVIDKSYLDTLLSTITWNFSRESSSLPEDKADSYHLYMVNNKPVANFNINHYIANLHNIFTKESHRSKICRHTWQEIAQYLENEIKKPLEDLTIWDAFYYDYQEWCTLDRHKDPTFNKYATKKFSKCRDRSQPLMALIVDAVHPPHTDEFIVTSTTSTPPRPDWYKGDADPPNMDMFNEFTRLLTGGGIQLISNIGFSRSLTISTYSLEVSLSSWGYFKKCFENYWKVSREKSPTPIHVHSEELNSLRKVEMPFTDLKLKDFPRTLDISVVTHLRNWNDFRLFTFSYLFNLLPRVESKDPGEPDKFKIIIPINRQTKEYELGNTNQLFNVLSNFLRRENEEMRTYVNCLWEEKMGEFKKDSSYPKNLLDDLHEKANPLAKIQFDPPKPNVNNWELINRDDLKLAMQSCVNTYINEIESNLTGRAQKS